MLKGKIAGVFGTTGNLGPLWVNTLRDAEVDVIEYNPPYWDARSEVDIQPMDIVVYNAAIDNPPGSDVNFFTSYMDIVDVNVLGAVRVAKSIIPKMIERGGGVFITVGSIQGFVGANYNNYNEGFEKPVGYNLSKAALVQLTRSIAVQYGRNNIRAVTIAFSCVDTEKVSDEFKAKFLRYVPLGRLVSKESLKTTLLYACSCPELTGQALLIDGAYTVI